MKDNGTISAKDLAAATGYSVRYLGALAGDELFPRAERGVYQADAAFRGIIKHLRTSADEARTGLASQRKTYLAARTRLLEAKLAIEQGNVIPRAAIGPALRNLSLHQRAMLQRKFESELPTKLAGLKAPEIQTLMAGAVDEVCAVFHDGVRAWMDQEP